MLLPLLMLTTDTTDDTARQWAERELAKAKYHERENLIERIIRWIKEQLHFDITAIGNRGTVTVVLVVLALIAAAVIALLVWRSIRARQGKVSVAPSGATAALFDGTRTADELFAAADAARRAHDDDTLVLELFRAMICLLDERGVIIIRPGLTATEAAQTAGHTLGHRELFMRGAMWFNQVFFADMPADERAVADLDALVDVVRAAVSSEALSTGTIDAEALAPETLAPIRDAQAQYGQRRDTREVTV